MKKVTGLVLDDQHWGALIELVGARVVDLRGYHGLRQDFAAGPGLFNVLWPADERILGVFDQLARMGLPPPEAVEGWETEYVSEQAAREAGVPRPAIAGEWSACAKEYCPLCTHGAPIGFFLDEEDAKLVEDTAAKIRVANPSFDAARAPLGGDEPAEDFRAPELEEPRTAAPGPGAAMPAGAPRAGARAAAAAAPPAHGLVIPATASVIPEKEPEPEPSGPPLEAVEVGTRVVLKVPEARWSLDLVTKLGAKDIAAVRKGDKVTGAQLDRIARDGAGFVAPLPFFSEVFLEGKPLDKKRFEAEAAEIAPGVRAMEAQLPRFGGVRVVVGPKGRFLTSEVALPAADLLALLG